MARAGAGLAETPGVDSAGALDAYLATVHARWLAATGAPRARRIPGSLLFADVSGFTALGEKLARRGRVGAEMLTEAVNAVFDGLLRPVHDLGGDVLKFGGDAVLVLFDGQGHEVRAATAGLAMQRAMRSVSRPVPGARLRCSIGVASGEVDMFLAGRTHNELVVAGPVAGAVVGCESAAGPGQVVADPGTFAAIGSDCAGEAIGPGYLIERCPTPLVFGPAVRPVGFAREGLPWHMLTGVSGEGEHRPITVGFVQFRGTDALLESEGPQALGNALDDLISTIQTACRRHEVTFVSSDVDRDAGKVVLVTGAPEAGPDDSDRMLHALREIVAAPSPLRVRAGANRGRAFVADLGTAERRTWTVMGDPVNLAARVMSRAADGTVLATPDALDHARDLFETEPVEPFMAKGKSEPVRASVVGEPRGTRATNEAGELFGRELELSVLQESIADARRGQGGVIELVGEPGIGKTTLLEAALRSARDLELLRFQAGPYAAHSAFRTLVEPLRALLLGDGPEPPEERLRARVAGVAPELLPWLPLIGSPLGLDLPDTAETAHLGEEFSAARMHDAVVTLLDRVLTPTAILAVEDTHWLDEASSDLLSAALKRLPARGRLFILTRRDTAEGLHPDGARVLPIGPIAAAAATELVRSDDQVVLSPEAVQRLVERSAGNPLFLRELLAAARSGEDVDSLPDTVEGLIAARIDTLPRADRTVLRQAAVLGVQFSERLLAHLMDVRAADVRPTLERLDEFVRDLGRGTLRFQHALLRDVAYEALPFRRRRELHRRAADLIERDANGRPEDSCELLALHCHAAHDWERSWRWSQLAGERALRHAAPAEAAGFLSRALEAGRAAAGVEIDALADVAERLGDAAKLAGRYEQASHAYQQAARRRRDPIAAAELCRKQGWLREETDSFSRALRWYAQGLRKLDDAPKGPAAEQLRVRLELARAAARWRQGRLRESVPLLEAAARDARRIRDRASLAHAYYVLGTALAELGRDGAVDLFEQALSIQEELEDFHGLAKTLTNIAADAYYKGDWARALEHYERSLEANERVGEAISSAISTMNVAEIRIEQGRLEDAEQPLRDSLATFRAVGFPAGVGFALANLGRVATARGDCGEAADLFGQARAVLEEIGLNAYVVNCQIREAERLLVCDRPAEALSLAGELRERLRKLGAQPLMLSQLQRVAGFAKRHLGDEEGARQRFEESLELARSINAAYEEAQALEALGRTDEAGAIFERLGVVARVGLTA